MHLRTYTRDKSTLALCWPQARKASRPKKKPKYYRATSKLYEMAKSKMQAGQGDAKGVGGVGWPALVLPSPPCACTLCLCVRMYACR